MNDFPWLTTLGLIPLVGSVLVAALPKGRELLYPGVANVIGNSLRELNLEDVEPAAASAPAKPTVVEVRTFDGLVVRVDGEKRNDASWVSLTASVDSAQAARAATATIPTPPAEGAGADTPKARQQVILSPKQHASMPRSDRGATRSRRSNTTR